MGKPAATDRPRLMSLSHSFTLEQAFRYNNRATRDNPLDDADRFALAVSQIAGKRLTYAELTGKTEPPSSPEF